MKHRVGTLCLMAVVMMAGGCALAQGRPDIEWMSGGHYGPVTSLAYSPDGGTIASAGWDQTVKLWRVSDRSLLRTLVGHSPVARGVAFAPDGMTVASCGDDMLVRLWRVSDGVLLRVLTGHTGAVNSVAFCPDGRDLASGSDDGTVRIWQLPEGSPVRTLTGSAAAVKAVAYSPDGATLAAGSADNTISLWQAASGTLARTLMDHTGPVTSVDFATDGSMLVSGGGDATVKLWNLADGALVRSLTGHTSGVTSVAFTPDNTIVVSGSSDNTACLWRVPDGALLRTITGHSRYVYSISVSPDGATLATGDGESTIRLWPMPGGSGVATLTGHSYGIASVAFAPDGSALASGSLDATVRLWRPADGALIRSVGGWQVLSMAYSADSSTIATTGFSGYVSVYRASDGTLVTWIDGKAGFGTAVALSPDGSLVAAAHTDISRGVARLWNVSDGSFCRTVEGRASPVHDLAFSRDGSLIACGHDDRTITLSRVSDGKLVRTLTGHADAVRCVVFSPDGATLASGSEDSTIRLWRLSDGSPIRTLRGHTGSVRTVAYSPDGAALASGSGSLEDADRSLRLWRAADGALLSVITEEIGIGIASVAYSPDGAHLAYGRSDSTVVVARSPRPSQGITALMVEPASGRVGQTVAIRARLTSGGGGVPGRTVTFGVGTHQTSATTDSSGLAQITHAISEDPGTGSTPVCVGFAGDSDFASSTGAGILTVTAAGSSVYVPDRSGIITTTVMLKGYLKRTTDNAWVVGRTLGFAVAGTAIGSASTNSSGQASLSYVIATAPGQQPIHVSFAGDAQYDASSSSSTLTATTTGTKVYVVDRVARIRAYTVLKAYLYTPTNTLIVGKPMSIKLDGTVLGSGLTNSSGCHQVGYTVAEGVGAGARTIMGEFPGDGGYTASANTGRLTVTQGSLYLWPYARTGKAGTPLSIRAYVRSLPDYMVRPGKTIAFGVDGVEIAAAQVDATGWATATWDIPADAATGAHTASATFAGDAWYLPVTASTAFTVVP